MNRTDLGMDAPNVSPLAWLDLLSDAREVSRAALQRMHTLSNHFPGDLPRPLLRQLERDHADPGSERRKGARVGTPPVDAVAFAREQPDRALKARMLERSPGGLALWLERPAEVGSVLLVRPLSPSGIAVPASVEVRHCRPANGGWVAGCLALDASAECPTPSGAGV